MSVTPRKGLRLIAAYAVIALLLGIGAASCSSTSKTSTQSAGDNTNNSTQGTSPKEKIPVKVFLSTGQSDWAFHVAKAKGYFADEGLDVTLTLFASGADAATAFQAQGADMIQAGDLPTVTFLPRADVSIIGDTDHHNGVLMVVPKRVTSANDLVGSSIAGTIKGSPGFWIAKYVDDNGLSGKVKIVNLQTDAQVAALLKGEVGAVISTSSTVGPLLARSKDYKVLGQWPSANFLMAGKQFMSKHPEAAVGVLKAIDRAWSYIQNNLTDAATIEAQADGITPEVPTGWLKDGYGLSFKPQFGKQEYDMLDQMSKWAASTGAIKAALDICPFVSLDPLKKAVPDADIVSSCPPA
jgi:ABC-type nitrate/sulfonate/bicarbonate transport system substrate-binding protein